MRMDKGPQEVLRALATGTPDQLAEALAFQRESFRAKFGRYPEEGIITKMRRSEEGGYDTWAVQFPDGKVREFGSLKKADMYVRAMDNKPVILADGREVVLTGLKVLHRYIPKWSEVINVTEVLAEQEALDQTE